MTSMLEDSTPGAGHDNLDHSLRALRFSVPSPPKHVVDRPRLVELLDSAEGVPLLLLSAPAGSGKTALVASWVAQRASAADTVWITFEAHEPVEADRFWSDLWQGVRGHLVGHGASPVVSVSARPDQVTELAVALSRLAHPVTLVLDGCELLSEDLAADLDFVLRHSDGALHVVLLTRVDPVLPLHRYRLEESMVEVRLADLAFTEDETRQLVQQSGLDLTAASVAALTARTRGWATGLRFATMVLSRCADPDGAVRELAGDRGNIAEYLMAEVLQTQPKDVRTLLMDTSVVDLLQPGLIEELGGPGAPRTLDSLARANVLVESIPDQPGCYRYHPFLRDLLRAELAFHAPAQRVRLHLKAARWFAREGALAAAVQLAAEVGAWAKASRLVVDDLAIGSLLLGEDGDEVTRLFTRLPAEAPDPDSALVRSALAAADGDLAACADALADARATSTSAHSAHGRSVSLAADLVDAVRAGLADDPASSELADHALRALHAHGDGLAGHLELVALVETGKGESLLRRGQLAAARAALSAGLRAARTVGVGCLMSRCLAGLAVVAALRGELQRAGDLASEAILRTAGATPRAQGRAPMGDAELALAWIAVEQADLGAADEHLRAAARSRPRHDDPLRTTLTALVKARLVQARPGAAGAVDVIEVIGRCRERVGPDWLRHALDVEEAAVRVADGEVERAAEVLETMGDAADADALVVVGAAQVARGDLAGAGRSVSAFHDRREVPSLGVQVRGALLEASYELERGERQRAKAALLRALSAAAPERLRRPFLEVSPAVRELLAVDTDLTQHAGWLRPAAGARARVVPLQRTGPISRPGDVPPADQVIEPLTAKELEVLEHLSELLSTEEIAGAMFVSVNTIRTHVRSILRKLAVSRRNEAVRRGRALGLVSA